MNFSLIEKNAFKAEFLNKQRRFPFHYFFAKKKYSLQLQLTAIEVQ